MTGRDLPQASGSPDHTASESSGTHDLLSFHEEGYHDGGVPDRNANHHSPEHNGETILDEYSAKGEAKKEKDSHEDVSVSGTALDSNGRFHVS